MLNCYLSKFKADMHEESYGNRRDDKEITETNINDSMYIPTGWA